MPGWNRSDITLKPGTQDPAHHTEFSDLLDDFSLHQCVTEPTRQMNTLDLYCTNLPEQANHVKVIPGISDHEIVFMKLGVWPNLRKQHKHMIWLYKNADWNGMINCLAPRFEPLERQYTPFPNDLWTFIKTEITQVLTDFILRCQTRTNDSHPWINKELHMLIRKKRNLYKPCMKRGSLHQERRYNMHRQTVKNMLRRRHADYIHNLLTDSNRIKDEFSKHLNLYQAQKICSRVNPHSKKATSLSPPPKKRQIFSMNSSPRSSRNHSRRLTTMMEDIGVDVKGVHKLRALKCNKAPKSDGISPLLLRELADILALPLTTLFQTSLNKGIVPQDWKRASICQLYKKGEKSSAVNYRPVSLTCVNSKIMKHISTSQLMPFAEGTGLFYTNQHGFRENHGWNKQLMELTANITNNLDDGQQTETCVTDFSKVFDKVNHNKLLQKLAHYGVSHQLIA